MWWLQCPKMEKAGAMLFILTKGISMALITAASEPSPKLHFPVRSARLEADSWGISVWWVDAAGVNLWGSLKYAKGRREKEWIVRVKFGKGFGAVLGSWHMPFYWVCLISQTQKDLLPWTNRAYLCGNVVSHPSAVPSVLHLPWRICETARAPLCLGGRRI